jgi:hypothetical protein
MNLTQYSEYLRRAHEEEDEAAVAFFVFAMQYWALLLEEEAMLEEDGDYLTDSDVEDVSYGDEGTEEDQ